MTLPSPKGATTVLYRAPLVTRSDTEYHVLTLLMVVGESTVLHNYLELEALLLGGGYHNMWQP